MTAAKRISQAERDRAMLCSVLKNVIEATYSVLKGEGSPRDNCLGCGVAGPKKREELKTTLRQAQQLLDGIEK
jgi:hypothetical protein